MFTVISVGFMVWALWLFFRNAPKNTWVFIALMILLPTLPLLASDLLFGGIRSIEARYFFPALISLSTAFAYTCVNQIQSASFPNNKFWVLVLSLITAGGIISSWQYTQATPAWWNKYHNQWSNLVADYINSRPHPLLLMCYSDEDRMPFEMLVLCRRLHPNVHLMGMKAGDRLPEPPAGFSQYLLYLPTPLFRHEVEQQYHCQLRRVLFTNDDLWEAIPRL